MAEVAVPVTLPDNEPVIEVNLPIEPETVNPPNPPKTLVDGL